MPFSINIKLPVHLELHGGSDNDGDGEPEYDTPELAWLHANNEQTWTFTSSPSTSSERQILTVTEFNVDSKALASGQGTLHIFTKTDTGQQQKQHVIKLNVHFVCAINEQEITLIRKEGKLYEEKLESLQGTVVPEYRGYALKTSLVGGTVLAAIALYTIPGNARIVMLPLNDEMLPNRLR